MWSSCCAALERIEATLLHGSEYNESLRHRGDLTVWVSDDVAKMWSSPRRKTRKGQAFYSELAIEICLTLRVLFRLALRQTQDFMWSIANDGAGPCGASLLDAIAARQTVEGSPKPARFRWDGHSHCGQYGSEIEINIPPPKSAVHGANKQRNQHIDAIAEHGRMKWQT
jgi:DDE family transposase